MISACAENTLQHREAPLPAYSPQARAEAYAKDMRTLDPSLSKKQASSLAAAQVAGEDARAEAEWRRKQKAAADREQFEKDLNAAKKPGF